MYYLHRIRERGTSQFLFRKLFSRAQKLSWAYFFIDDYRVPFVFSVFFSFFFFLYRISFRDHVFCPGVPSVSMKSIHTRWLITIKTIYIIVIISLLKHLNEICKNISSKSIFVFFFSLHFTKIIDKLKVIHGYLFDFFCNIKICVRSTFFFTNIDIDKYDCIMF